MAKKDQLDQSFQNDQNLMRTLAAMSGRLESAAKLLSAISLLTKVVGQPWSPAQGAAATLDILVGELGDIEHCSILIQRPDRGVLEVLAAWSRTDSSKTEARPFEWTLAPGQGVAGRVFAEQRPYFWHPDSGEPEPVDFGPDAVHPRSLACLPLVSWEHRIGVLSIAFGLDKPFPDPRKRDLTILGGVVANIIQTFLLKADVDEYAVSLVQKVTEVEREIAGRKEAQRQLEHMAYHDALTGLPNRKSFYERIEDVVNQSSRRKDAKWALFFLDLDRFKQVNDTFGHDFGDELLKQAGQRIKTCLRKTDYLYRLGGDEFTVIVNYLTQTTDASYVAQKIVEAMVRPFTVGGHDVFISTSVGISLFPEDGRQVEDLVRHADLAMYAAKEEENGYRYFTEEINRRAMRRIRLERDLIEAIDHNHLTLFYQPVVDKGGRIVAAEALIRWRHPETGLILPGQFIPLAEEMGLMVNLDEWVLHVACRRAARWHAQGFRQLSVAVNVSAGRFGRPDFAAMVMGALEETGFDPAGLQLELTEATAMDDPEETIAKMTELHRLGVGFSLDDIGAGSSSVSYLRLFPISTLKIGPSFVENAPLSEADAEIVRTIIAMARSLSMTTIAEGVETAEQSELLALAGCDLMQGHFFGPPMPVGDFEDLIGRK